MSTTATLTSLVFISFSFGSLGRRAVAEQRAYVGAPSQNDALHVAGEGPQPGCQEGRTMRLGFRKANNGSSRGKQWNPKMMSSPVTAASRDGTDVPWPPLWPGDDASGRGGIGPGGRGHRGAAERSGRGGALAVRVRPAGVGPTAEGEGRSYQAVLTTPRVFGRRTAACRRFPSSAGRGRAGGVRSRALSAGAGACEIGSSAPALCGARVDAVEVASAAAFWANATAWLTTLSALTEPSFNG
jgi:hypothetical protein